MYLRLGDRSGFLRDLRHLFVLLSHVFRSFSSLRQGALTLGSQVVFCFLNSKLNLSISHSPIKKSYDTKFNFILPRLALESCPILSQPPRCLSFLGLLFSRCRLWSGRCFAGCCLSRSAGPVDLRAAPPVTFGYLQRDKTVNGYYIFTFFKWIWNE